MVSAALVILQLLQGKLGDSDALTEERSARQLYRHWSQSCRGIEPIPLRLDRRPIHDESAEEDHTEPERQ